ncbi:MAG: DNA replication and repair protein RecF, partial [Oscillospiraceae bacterium]
TSVGPHRDDLDIQINHVSAKAFASQGQQRSAVLAFKMAECGIIEQVSGERPVVLLDDVLSELDEMRREYLLHQLTERQIFLTCCDPRQTEGIGREAVFLVSEGTILIKRGN